MDERTKIARAAHAAPLAAGHPNDLSTALGFVRTHGEVMCYSEFTEPWAISFSAVAAHLHLVEHGSMFVVPSGKDPIFVEVGAIVFIGPGTSYRIASATDVPAVTIRRALSLAGADAAVLRFGGGGHRCDVVCSQFTLEGVVASRVARHLPSLFVVHPDASPSYAWLSATSRFIIDELHRPRPGSGLMTVRLLDLLFVQVLRVWAEPEPARLAWLTGLDDPQIGALSRPYMPIPPKRGAFARWPRSQGSDARRS